MTIEVDEDQADWGSTKIYDDGDLTGLWVPDKGVGHWGGSTIPPILHINCRRILRGWQRFHLGKGWRDIAYNYGFCNHSVRFRLRGWNPSGATSGDYEGDGIRENAEAVAVVWIGGAGGQMKDAALAAAGDLWRQIHAQITLEPQVGIGHKDVKATSCPGSKYYDWIHNRGWQIAPPPPPPTPTTEDNMLPLIYGDGAPNGETWTHPGTGRDFVTKRRKQASDVAAIQGVLRRAGATVTMTHGVYDDAMAFALTQVTPGTAGNGLKFGGDDWDSVFFAAYGGTMVPNPDVLTDGDTVTLTKG